MNSTEANSMEEEAMPIPRYPQNKNWQAVVCRGNPHTGKALLSYEVSWHSADPMEKALLLKDWIKLLQAEYDSARAILNKRTTTTTEENNAAAV